MLFVVVHVKTFEHELLHVAQVNKSTSKILLAAQINYFLKITKLLINYFRTNIFFQITYKLLLVAQFF